MATLAIEINKTAYTEIPAVLADNIFICRGGFQSRVHFGASKPAVDTNDYESLDTKNEVQGHAALKMYVLLDQNHPTETAEGVRLY